eukprot:1156838-Pelagomonas_calceolata.AAC.3
MKQSHDGGVQSRTVDEHLADLGLQEGAAQVCHVLPAGVMGQGYRSGTPRTGRVVHNEYMMAGE